MSADIAFIGRELALATIIQALIISFNFLLFSGFKQFFIPANLFLKKFLFLLFELWQVGLNLRSV